jgi:hypothetical protein
MDDAGLDRGLRKDRFDRLRKAFQAIDDGAQDVLDPAGLQIVHALSQNLAPSVVSIQSPRMSFVPSAATPSAGERLPGRTGVPSHGLATPGRGIRSPNEGRGLRGRFADRLDSMARDFNAMKTTAVLQEAVMSKIIDKLKTTIKAEKAKLLTEPPQSAEPQSSAIRKEIEARETLLARLTDRAPPDRLRRNRHRLSGNWGPVCFGRLKVEL